MCDMAQASLYSQVGGVAMGTVGSYYSAQAEKTSLQGEADIHDINAKIADSQYREEILIGREKQQAHQLQGAAFKSSQRASMGASGNALSSGSSIDVLTSTDVINEIDENTIVKNALKSAWGYKMQGVDDRNKALMARTESKSISPFMSATTTLLTGAGKIADRNYKFKQLEDSPSKKEKFEPIGPDGPRRQNIRKWF